MSTPAPELVTEKLREALAELRRPINPATQNGWAQGNYGLPYACKCLDGALRYVVTWRGHGRAGDELHEALRRRVADVIIDITGVARAVHPAAIIHSWNDNEDRVFAEVEAVLERAIAHAPAVL